MQDLLDNKNQLYKFEDFVKKYNIDTNFLEYFSVTQSLPKNWKYFFVEDDHQEYKHLISSSSFTCKDIYWELIKGVYEIPEKYAKYWERELEIYIDEIEWVEEYIECFSWTKSIKLRSFYYQIRVRDIMCNSKLCKMKIIENPACEWCKHAHQDIIHLFYECKVAQGIWKEVEKCIFNTIGCKIDVKPDTIFIMNVQAGNFTGLLKLIILLTCRYIYVTKCTGDTPKPSGAINYIYECEKLERGIAVKNNNILKHAMKWNNFADI